MPPETTTPAPGASKAAQESPGRPEGRFEGESPPCAILARSQDPSTDEIETLRLALAARTEALERTLPFLDDLESVYSRLGRLVSVRRKELVRVRAAAKAA